MNWETPDRGEESEPFSDTKLSVQKMESTDQNSGQQQNQQRVGVHV